MTSHFMSMYQKHWNSNALETAAFKWRSREKVPRKHSFCDVPGLKVELHESTPLEVFKEFITDELLAHVVEETNRYVRVDTTYLHSIAILRLCSYSGHRFYSNLFHLLSYRFVEQNES